MALGDQHHILLCAESRCFLPGGLAFESGGTAIRTTPIQPLGREIVGGKMKLPRAILADDPKILLEAFRKLLQPHCDVVATVSDGHALLHVAATFIPDVILLDIGMPLLNGLEAGRQLKKKMSAVKLIILTMHQDADLAVEAIRYETACYL